MRIPPMVIPKEHGASAVLLVPMMVAVTVTQTYSLINGRTNLLMLLLGIRLLFAPGQMAAQPSSLQERIKRASPGDTILVPHGIYEGNIVINKVIMLLGIEKPVIHGTGTGSVVTLTADSCIIEGFIIEHSGTMLVDEDAGILVKSHCNRILDNDLRDVLFGIYFFHADRNVTMNNTVTGRRYLGLGERGSGIHIWNSRGNVFTGNTITDARDGFYIQNASRMRIEGNEVFGVRYGLHYMYADSNEFFNNTFHDNVAGAAIMYSSGILMRHNRFEHNRGFASFGILFQDCHYSVADSNVISDNVVGLFFEASTDNCFRHNVIARNDAALEMFQNATGNTFTENNFIDNLTPLLLVGKHTGTHWGLAGRGNYWSSYEGYDLNDDGIGDVPMKIQNVFEYLEGKNPNLRLYLYSAASQALAAATKAFPIIDINSEIDEHPLMQPTALHLPGIRQRTARAPDVESDGTSGPALTWMPAILMGTALFAYVIVLRTRKGAA